MSVSKTPFLRFSNKFKIEIKLNISIKTNMENIMDALVYKNGKVEMGFLKKPALESSHDVIVRISLSGICGTDLNVIKGNFDAVDGVVMGHEAVGIVEEIGAQVDSVKVGDRVVIDPTMWCGNCEMCRRNKYNLCHNKKGIEVGLDYDGTFARHAKFPEKFLYRIPSEMSNERAVMIEPLACVINNFEAANVQGSDAILILGGGPIGGLCGMYAERQSAVYTIFELDTYRVSYLQRIGLDAKNIEHDISSEKIVDMFFERTGRAPSVVIDTTGVLVEKAIECVEKGGVVVSMGFNQHTEVKFNLLHITNNAIKIVGAGDYNASIQKAIDSAARLPVERFVSGRYAIEEFSDAFSSLDHSSKNGIRGMKIVFDLDKEKELVE